MVAIAGDAQRGTPLQRSGRPELLEALSTGEMPAPEVLAAVPPGARADLAARVALRAGYASARPVPRPTDSEMDAIDDKRRALEAYLVACAGRRDIASTAARYASTAALAYEWEGYSEGPLAEAAHAEQYLRRYPRSVLRGGLELFLLVRYRAAFEAASYQGNREDQQIAADGYRAAWARVQSLRDRVIRVVARDVDDAPRVYMGADGHPRTFGR
jgi:hypothetical protein